MKHSSDFPPNIQSIREVFPDLDKYEPMFTYGKVLYNPFNKKISPDLEAHEKAHSDRQGDNPSQWWYDYLTSREFRLQEEIIGYGTQIAYISKIVDDRKLLEWMKEKAAEALSGGLYGYLCSYGEAESKIRNYAKTLL